ATSRNAIPRTPKSIDLKAPGTGSDQDPQAGAPGGPITGNRVVPCAWQKTPKSGPMTVAGDTFTGISQGVIWRPHLPSLATLPCQRRVGRGFTVREAASR